MISEVLISGVQYFAPRSLRAAMEFTLVLICHAGLMYLRDDLKTGYGLRICMEIYGSKREQTVFHEHLQEACFVLTEITENLWKPSGVYGRMKSRNPVLQFPLDIP